MQRRREPDESFGGLVTFGAMYCWLAPVMVAVFGRSQFLGGLLGVAGLAGLALAATRLPGISDVEGLYRDDRWMAIAVGLVAVAPVLMLGYAVTGSVWPLGGMIVAGTAALVIRYVVRSGFEWTED